MPRQEMSPGMGHYSKHSVYKSVNQRPKSEKFFSDFIAKLTMDITDHGVIGKLKSCTYEPT